MISTAVMNESKILLNNTFPELTDVDIDTLSDVVKSIAFPEGVEICKQGEEGDCLYIVQEGQTNIIVHAGNGEEIIVDTIGPGVYFGEMSLLGETTRSATIRTLTPCRLLQISHDDFDRAITANPGLLRRLMRRIIGHLRRNDRAVIKELNHKNSELVKAYDELAEQEQLRSQFVATLTHEIRTPLTKIRGYLDLVGKGAMNDQAFPLAMDAISRNVEHLVGLTNEMFLLYEMNPVKLNPTRIDVPDLLIEAMRVTRESVNDRETAVYLNIDPDVPTLIADRKTILLALSAIMGNAFKFDPTGSAIRMEARCKNDFIAISIQDQGIGIPPHEQTRIFEPFYRLEVEGSAHLFPGIGVGLTIANIVVQRHNGRIEVDSIPGQGSTFTLLLPIKS